MLYLKKKSVKLYLILKAKSQAKAYHYISLLIITYHCLHKEKDVKENDKNKIGESF